MTCQTLPHHNILPGEDSMRIRMTKHDKFMRRYKNPTLLGEFMHQEEEYPKRSHIINNGRNNQLKLIKNDYTNT